MAKKDLHSESIFSINNLVVFKQILPNRIILVHHIRTLNFIMEKVQYPQQS